jgi:hypothetical protein
MTNIPVYINGQFVYTPAVNRLLQLTANLYDSSTTNFYPTVFRPLFGRDSFNNIYIIGYTNIASASGINTLAGMDGTADFQLSLPYSIAQLTNLALTFPNFTPITDNANHIVNVYGVPWIIGAKKGFPNFNKFGMQENIQIWRRLQIKRNPNTLSSPPSIPDFIITNQLYDFSISNMLGIDCWNSYSNTYAGPVYVTVNDTLSMAITNSYGAPASSFSYDLISTNITVSSWAGYNAGSSATANTQSFVVLLQMPIIILTNSAFYFGTTPPGVQGFYPDLPGQVWETSRGTFDLPQFGLQTTNRLQVSMVDFSNGVYHLLDYVQLTGPEKSLDINSTFQTSSVVVGYANMWSTNLNNVGLPYGIVSQLLVAEGQQGIIQTFWDNNPTLGVPGATAQEEADGFCSFMGLASPYPNQPPNNPGQQYYATNSIVQVPYTPLVTISDYLTYQANDPEVHYLTSDLSYNGREYGNNLSTGVSVIQQNLTPVVSPNYNLVNIRYQPWGVNDLPSGISSVNHSGYDTNAFNLSYRDPLVSQSDSWSFPTNGYSLVNVLGQIHRGTPWQTVYLKADNILNDSLLGPGTGTNTWMAWTGDTNASDAAIMAPVADWQLASLLAGLLNTNDPTQLMSVNDSTTSDWLNTLNGLMVYSNTLTLPSFTLSFSIASMPVPTFNTNVMTSNSPAAWIIANGIAQTKATQPNNNFNSLGDILATSALTESSPWLNTSSANQLRWAITDAAYEAIPNQLLWLLRPDSIGTVSSTNGGWNLQFSGSDAYRYALQRSTDLIHWDTVSTNCPVQGNFNAPISPGLGSQTYFYRSILIP